MNDYFLLHNRVRYFCARFSIFRTLLVTAGIAASVVAAQAFPTNTGITATRVNWPTNPSLSEIVLSVYDDQRSQNVSWTSSLGEHTTPIVVDGMAGWSTLNGAHTLSHHFAVYDPGCGCWKVYSTSLFGTDTDSDFGLNDGVAGYTKIRYSGSSSTTEHCWVIYDPESAAWIGDQSTISAQNQNLIIRDTAVGWSELIYPTGWPTNPTKIRFHFSIYDPTRKEWREVTTNQYTLQNGDTYGINYGTATYVATGNTYKVGYNHSTGQWVNGADTVPLAYFVPSNPTGNTPLKTYMWDMSLGASSWSYAFGDGGSSTNRSPFYTYLSAVGTPYTAQLTVTGPGGSDAETKILTPTTTHSISGTVANAGGFAVAGATVTLSGAINRTTQTNGSGNYSFTNLTGGQNYSVTVDKSRYGFAPATRTFSSLSGANTGNFVASLYDTPADFDGDGISDPSIFRSSTGAWWGLNSSNSSSWTTSFGLSSDVAEPGDYDGDGKTDIAVWRDSNATWYILRSSDSTSVTTTYGSSSDIPTPADYDGDDKTDLALFRPSNGTWYVFRSSTGSSSQYAFGLSTDNPAPGDYDGDDKADLAVFRSSDATWHVSRSSDSTYYSAQFGSPGDKVVQGDYDGDGKTDMATFRAGDQTWRVYQSSNSTTVSQSWGLSTDVLAAGDFDGDGKLDYTVFRPSSGSWYILRSSDQTWSVPSFGTSGDYPVPNSYFGN